ncbi:MAG: MCP four helix bundle domain-containing protein, partial [Dissulfurispiraceae bacterium]
MTVLKNMKIGMRLSLGFGLVVIMLIATSLIGIANIKNVMEATHRITQDRWPKTVMGNTIVENINVVARAIRNAILVDNAEDMKTELGRVQEARKVISGELEKLDKTVKGDREREAFKRVEDARSNYRIPENKLINLIESGKKADATALMFADFRSAQAAYFNAVDNLNKFEASLMEEDSRESDGIYDRGRNLLIGISGMALLLTIGIAFLITRGITRPLAEAVGSANKVAAGDLNFSIVAAGKDETGQLLSAMGNMAEKIRGLAGDVNALSDAAVEGNLDMRADATKHQGEFRKIVEGVNNTIGSLVGIVDSMPLPSMIIDKEFSIRYMNQTGAKLLNTSQKQLAGNKCYDYFKTSDCHTDNCACAQAMRRVTEATRETDAHPIGY